MEKKFNFKNGILKIMYNEKCVEKDYGEEYLSYTFECTTKHTSKCYFVGIELMLNRGGRICYGLLNVKVKPSIGKGKIKISIAYTPYNTVNYEKSMLLEDEYVYKGLPEEYIVSLKESINQVIAKKELYPQCDITFEEAVNCEVGSSPMIFGLIAEIIMEVIYADEIEEIFSMEIEQFSKKYIKSANLLKY